MPEGTVKFFNNSKGFGFITPADGSKDVFVHATGLTGEVRDGDAVTYELQDTPKGPAAVQVKKV
jgi:CspA family cold shock protein